MNKVMGQDQVSAAEVKVTDTLTQLGVQRLTVTTGREKNVLAQLLASTRVSYAELNYIVTVH